jgi:hypothetical protein
MIRAALARFFARISRRLDPVAVTPIGNRTWLRMELENMNAETQPPNLDGLVEYGRFGPLTRKVR